MLTPNEKSVMIYQMRNDGYTFKDVMKRIKEGKLECYRLARVDIRLPVSMHCNDCGAGWREMKMPWDRVTFHRCASCASREWQKVQMQRARVEKKDQSQTHRK